MTTILPRLTFAVFLALTLACGNGEPAGETPEPAADAVQEGLPDPEDEEEQHQEAEDPAPAGGHEDLMRALETMMTPGPAPGSVGNQVPGIGSSPGVLDPALSGRYKITDALLDEYARVATEVRAAARAGKSMQAVLDRHGWPIMKYSYVVSRVRQAAMLDASGSPDGTDLRDEVKAHIAELEERLREHPDEKAQIGLELNMLRMKLVALQQVGGFGPSVDPEARAETERIKRWMERLYRAEPR